MEKTQPTFTFRESDHTYWLNGVEIPSVTRILDSVGLISPFAKQGEAAERGTLVHECCALLANDRLDWATVDPRLLGYVMSFAKFLEQTAWKILATEVSVFDEEYLFAGTYDLLFDRFVIDLKTGGPAKWHALQTAAYKRLIDQGRTTNGKRGTVYLRADGGTPAVIEHTDRSDWPNFLSCLNVYRLKEQANGSHFHR